MANSSKSYNASHHDRQSKTRSWPGRGQVDNRVDAYVDIAIQVFRRAEARGVDATLPAPATRTSCLKCNCTPYFLFCSQGAPPTTSPPFLEASSPSLQTRVRVGCELRGNPMPLGPQPTRWMDGSAFYLCEHRAALAIVVSGTFRWVVNSNSKEDTRHRVALKQNQFCCNINSSSVTFDMF